MSEWYSSAVLKAVAWNRLIAELWELLQFMVVKRVPSSDRRLNIYLKYEYRSFA